MAGQFRVEDMLSVEEARRQILAYFHVLEPESVPALEALGRVLAGDVRATYDIPPFQNSAMDGYAVRAADVAAAAPDSPVALRVIGDLGAGYTTRTTVQEGTAIRIMTGAPMPDGADAVVRFEETDEGGAPAAAVPGQVRVFRPVRAGDNVRQAGEDVRTGELVLPAGSVVRPSAVGALTSLGRTEVAVTRRPRVAILATGDEVVEPWEPLAPGKIRNINSYTVAAQVKRYGGIPTLLGIARDEREELTARLRQGLQHDFIVSSGGVSVGDYDMVKNVLQAEGEMHLWLVRMKPGKPLAFGQISGVPVMGLPGNPVSAMVSFEQFGRPALLKMQGRSALEKPEVEAILDDEVDNSGGRRNFVRVQVARRDGAYHARLTGEQGSGILTSMVRGNGLAIIPEDWPRGRPGDRVRVQMLDWDTEQG